MLESLFNKVTVRRPCNFSKKRLQQVIFCEICEIFKNTFFYRTPPVAASEEQIAEEVQNFPCLYDKGSRATKNNIGKRMHDLGAECLRLRRIIKAI